MRDGQDDTCDGNHGALENHVSDLLVRKRPLEALGKLGNTEDATDEDGDGCNNEC